MQRSNPLKSIGTWAAKFSPAGGEGCKVLAPKAPWPMFQPKDRPDEKPDFLFFSGSSMKFEIRAKIFKKYLSIRVLLIAEKMEPIFASDVSLLAPAKK